IFSVAVALIKIERMLAAFSAWRNRRYIAPRQSRLTGRASTASILGSKNKKRAHVTPSREVADACAHQSPPVVLARRWRGCRAFRRSIDEPRAGSLLAGARGALCQRLPGRRRHRRAVAHSLPAHERDFGAILRGGEQGRRRRH